MQHACGIINLYQKITIAVLHHKLMSQDLQDQCHPSLKMFRMGLKAVISSSLGWVTAAACGAEPGKPGEWCTCWGRCGTGCHHGSVLSLQTQGYSLHIPDTLLHARQNLTLLCTPLLHHLQPERLLSDLNDL